MGLGLTRPQIGILSLAHGPFAQLLETWRRIEALGFASLHLADHLIYPRLISYECWTALGAMAQGTTRVRIGALGNPVTFRHPALLAHHASTADRMSGGRFELGIGAGGAGGDEVALGHDPMPAGERVGRLEECLEICDRLLRGEAVAHAGRRYRVRTAVPAGIQRPRPPIAVAARGPRALTVAARYADIWINQGGRDPGTDPADTFTVAVRRVVAERTLLDAACAALGRDPRAIRRRVLDHRATPAPFGSLDAFDEFIGRFVEIGMDEFVFRWPEAPDGSRDPVAERVLERVAAERLG